MMSLSTMFAPKARVFIRVLGFVYEGSFHLEVQTLTRRLGLRGWIHITPNQSVEMELEGPQPVLNELVDELRAKAALSRQRSFEVSWKPGMVHYTNLLVNN